MVQAEKIEAVKEIAERLERAQTVVFVGYKGLSVAKINVLRNELRKNDGELKVFKNRLTRLSLAEAGCDALDDVLVGPSALAFGYGEPSGPAKICAEFAKTEKLLEIKGGLLEKKRIDFTMIQTLANLPSRAELLTQMAGTLMAPARQMVTAMNQALSKIVYAMKERADQLEA